MLHIFRHVTKNNRLAAAAMLILSVLAIYVGFYLLLSPIADPQPVQNNTPTEKAVSKYNVLIKSNVNIGQYLADKDANRLAFYSKDVDGASHCTGACLQFYKPFFVEEVSLADEDQLKYFGKIVRPDGRQQTTYKGWPLYVRNTDSKEFSATDIEPNWYIAKPDYDIMVGNKDNQDYLVDSFGHTLYAYANDAALGVSTCEDSCLENWPPFFVDQLNSIPNTLSGNDFMVIDANNGGTQIAYKKQPLYYYSVDRSRGSTNGQFTNGLWFIVDPTEDLE